MPAPTVLPRSESSLEKTLSAFANRNYENYVEKRETDTLADIYRDYKSEGKSLEDAIMSVQTRQGVSPTTRVNTVNNLLNLKKTNVALQAQQNKINEKTEKTSEKNRKEQEKAQRDKEQDRLEIEYFDSIKDKNLKSFDIYKGLIDAGVDRVRAKDAASLHRMGGREERLTQADVGKQYDYELRNLDKQIKEIFGNTAEKKELQAQREKLQEQRRKDLARLRKGEDDFVLAMHETADDVKPETGGDVGEPEDPVSIALAKTFPPAQYKGQSKWNLKTNTQYKSDGERWIKVK